MKMFSASPALPMDLMNLFFFSPLFFFTANPLGCSEADHLVIGGVFVVLRGVFKLEKQLVWIL